MSKPALPAYSGGRPATTAPRQECRRLRRASRNNSPVGAAATGNGSSITRARPNRTPRRRGELDMLDGGHALWRNGHVLKRLVGVGMFQRRSHQHPKPRPVTPPELKARLHNRVAAHPVPKCRRPFRISKDVTKGVFHVNAAKDNSSCRTVLLPPR